MLKLLVVFLSLFSVSSARVLNDTEVGQTWFHDVKMGSDPKTWSPSDACDMCNLLVSVLETEVCQVCPGATSACEKIFERVQVCKILKVC